LKLYESERGKVKGGGKAVHMTVEILHFKIICRIEKIEESKVSSHTTDEGSTPTTSHSRGSEDN